MQRAYETGKPQNIMLHTIRLEADLWRQYSIRFDPEHNEVAVRIGPVVNTGQTPLPGSEPLPPSSPPLGGSPPSSPPLVGPLLRPPRWWDPLLHPPQRGGQRGGERHGSKSAYQ